MSERIHKLLSNLGYGSRREIEEWVLEGRLTVNGKVATVGNKIEEDDTVKLDGKHLSLRAGNEPMRVLLYRKRVGEMVTRDDPEGRRTVFRKLPELETGRWIAVGRLDVNTSGLLLMTNHGELARRLMHPSFEQSREYAVRALGEIDDGMLDRLRAGVELEDGPARFDSIRFGDNEGNELAQDDDGEEGEAGHVKANRWFVVTISEGRHREVRRLFESQNLQVSRLIRTAYGPITLGRGIRTGTFREGSKDELNRLMDAVGLDHAEALPERVRESHRMNSEYSQSGPNAIRRGADLESSTKAARGAATKPTYKSGADGWGKASKGERKLVDRAERFEHRTGRQLADFVPEAPLIEDGAPRRERPAAASEAPVRSFAGKPAAGPWAKARTSSSDDAAPAPFKARGFGAPSTRSYSERGDSAPPVVPRPRAADDSAPSAYGKKPYGKPAAPSYGERSERPAAGGRPYSSRDGAGAAAAYKKPYGERPAAADGDARPRFKPRAEGAPAYKKPYAARPAAGGDERPRFNPRSEAPARDGERPAYKKTFGERPPKPSVSKPYKPFGERPARSSEGRSEFSPRGAAPAARPYSERPRPPAREGAGSYKSRNADRPAGAKKPTQSYSVKNGVATRPVTKPKLGLRAKKDSTEE